MPLNVQHREHIFPFMYRVALPLLSAQASGVTSERVFSSSKETDTLRRTSMSPATMEVLQVLKYSIREKHREREGGTGVIPASTANGQHADALAVHPEAEDGDEFRPGRITDVLRAMREDSRGASVT